VGTLRPCGAKRTYVTGGAGPSQTQRIDEPLSVGRGQPVGPLLATSTDGGGIAADPSAARPVQVTMCACVLSFLPVPSGDCPRYPSSWSLVRPYKRAGYEPATVDAFDARADNRGIGDCQQRFVTGSKTHLRSTCANAHVCRTKLLELFSRDTTPGPTTQSPGSLITETL
jgi:hypothetical protein